MFTGSWVGCGALVVERSFVSCCEGLSHLVIVVQVVRVPDMVFGTAFVTFACGQTSSPQNLADGRKSTSPNCKQMGLDLIFFIVQMGATGLPRYTFAMQR
jgi:hypothetical protein